MPTSARVPDPRPRSTRLRACIAPLLLVVLPLADGAAADCLARLDDRRAAIDAEFKELGPSPLTEDQKARFTGLAYYPGDPTLCVEASFARSDEPQTFAMPTFDDRTIPFRRYGTFTFAIDGTTATLAAFQRMDLPDERRQWLLIPFRDATNGRETYDGGRYLEVDLPAGANTVLDFNRASNPWCAYNPKFACPIPPAENRLAIPIEAGEKDFAKPD